MISTSTLPSNPIPLIPTLPSISTPLSTSIHPLVSPSISPTLNRRMPNCTIVVQTAGDLFEPEIRLKNLSESVGIVQLMVKQRFRLCFAFVCNSTENTGFLKFCRFHCVFQKSNQNSSKIHKMTFCMQRSMCKKVTNFESLKVS